MERSRTTRGTRSALTVPVARGRLFYGWVVVALCFWVLAVAYGIQFSYGVFLPAIAADTGWSRTSLSLPYSLYVFVYSALGAVAGWCTDRWGPRIVIACGGVLLGSGILLTSQAVSLWEFYLSLGLIAALGMSTTYVPCNATVVRWFVRRRGLALSLSSSGASFGNLILPPVAAALITAYDWRTSYILLGLFAIVLIVPCAAFIIREPERLGLLPDGQAPAGALGTVQAPAGEAPQAWPLAAARRTWTFWNLAAVYTLTYLVVFLPLVHVVPLALDLGIPQAQAATSISAIGAGGLAGRLLAGTISDRIGRLPALALCLSMQALAFAGFLCSTGIGLLMPSALIFGFSFGGTTTLMPAIVADFFGRLAVGAILGSIWTIAASAAAFGPVVAGYVYDRTGSYSGALALGAVLNLAALFLLLSLRRHRP